MNINIFKMQNNINCVTCYIRGGLGNQLFQIFATISYALDNNIKFGFPDYKGVMAIDNVTKRLPHWDNLLINLKPYIKNIKPGTYMLNERQINKYNKLPSLANNTNDIILIGYFQSHKYFQNNKNKILKLIDFSKHKQRFENKDTISMHFRLGDYKINTNAHPIMPVEYYIKALNTIILKTKKDDWVVEYCCENVDIEDVNKKISILSENYPNIVFKRIDNNLEDWEQMIYMSCCKHNIIANSTFSWWSAYLNEDNDKVVCYPSLWVGEKWINDNCMEDLFLKDWNKITI